MVRPWELVESRWRGDCRVFSLREDLARSPRTGEVFPFLVLHTPDWVGVVPITADGKVVMVRQYRHGTKEITLEIPGGLVEKGDPQESARRELLEETGYAAKDLELLAVLRPQPAFMDNYYYAYLARDAYPAGGQRLDPAEDIEVVLVPLEEVPKRIAAGEITHSLVVCTFYFVFAHQPTRG